MDMMTTAPVPQDGPARAEFTGETSELAGILGRGSALQVVTLGLYRFWYLTNVRRHLWGHTRVDGDALEYTGTGRELFLGFLTALAIFVPLYAGISIAVTFIGGMLAVAISLLLFPLLAFLGQYAVYRARRYRLTRTTWRGLRFHQTGSAWAYAGRASLWMLASLLTLGIAWPFAQADLERYKVGNTWYGDRQGEFTGTGGGLFARLWLAIVLLGAPIVIAVFAGLAGLGGGLEEDAALGIGGGAISFVVLFAFALLPMVTANLFRWWADHIRFGEVTFRSEVRTSSFYGAYILYGLLVAVTAGPLLGAAGFMIENGTVPGLILGAVLYIFGLTLLSALFQLMVVRRLWKRQWETLQITGMATLTGVQAQGDAASAFGEGLADALDVGAF